MDTLTDATVTFQPIRRQRRGNPRVSVRRLQEAPQRQRRSRRLAQLRVLATVGRTA